VRKNHSKDKFNEIRKIWMICDKGGKIRSIKPLNGSEPQQQQDDDAQGDGDDDTQRNAKPKKGRKTGSRKTGCEFKLTITRTPDNEWAVEVLNDTHPSVHPFHRKLTQDKEKLLKSMADRATRRLQLRTTMDSSQLGSWRPRRSPGQRSRRSVGGLSVRRISPHKKRA